jgi:hypothetical protein
MVIPIERLNETVLALSREFCLKVFLVGDRTNSKFIQDSLSMFEIPIVEVNEDKSTIEGRYRYLKENSRGLARLIPIGLRIPKCPYDDYVALVIAERYLKNYNKITGGK